MKKVLLPLAMLLALCLVLSACNTAAPETTSPGPDTASVEPETTLPASDTPETTAPADAPDTESDLDYVKGKGTMVIGYTVYEPMNFTDSDGNFTGFDTELAKAVCEKLGVTPEFVEINWDTKEVELSAKSIDCIWNGLTIDDERKKNMAITVPYVKNAQVVVMKADAEYADASSLIGKTVCAEAGSAGEKTIQGDESLQQAEYVAKDVQTACLMEVSAGTADAAVLDLTLANAMIGEGTDYAGLVIKDRLAVEDYGVAFRLGSDICEAVNTVFQELLSDGTMADLANKYGLDLAQ